jgi:hypothetical protein
MWESVNATLNPDLKAKLMADELTVCYCPQCRLRLVLQYPLLYHDQNRKIMVWYLPPDDSGRVHMDRASFDAPKMYERISPGYEFRVVKSIHELKEKIRIFDAGLNDMGVEVLKMLLVTKAAIETGIQVGLNDFKLGAIRGNIPGTGDIVFEVQDRNSGVNHTYSASSNMYDEAANTVNHMLQELAATPSSEWRIVDASFVLALQEQTELGGGNVPNSIVVD